MFFILFLNVHLVHLSTNVFRSSVESNASKNICLFAGLDAERQQEGFRGLICSYAASLELNLARSSADAPLSVFTKTMLVPLSSSISGNIDEIPQKSANVMSLLLLPPLDLHS